MDLVCETTHLLVTEHAPDAPDAPDEEAAALSTSPTRKKNSPSAQQVAALMLITIVWPFSFEMIYPFINQVQFRPAPLRSLQHVSNVDPEIVYHGNWSYRQPRGCRLLLWLGGEHLRSSTVIHQ
jgi:hypothetical protein